MARSGRPKMRQHVVYWGYGVTTVGRCLMKLIDVGVRQYRDRARYSLSASEILTVEPDAGGVGFYIPIRRVDEDEARLALEHLREAVQRVLDESGMTEEELSAALDLNRPFDDAPGR